MPRCGERLDDNIAEGTADRVNSSQEFTGTDVDDDLHAICFVNQVGGNELWTNVGKANSRIVIRMPEFTRS